MVDAKAIHNAVIGGYADDNKWVDARFEAIKRLSNTKAGDAGQDFVERLCNELGFDTEFPEGRSRQSSWDVRIEGMTFELKTATEDVHGSFQFNHIRYHRPYDGLLCVGISPDDIGFDAWSKADVATGAAGRLVSMDQGSSATWKLTKRAGQLRPIEEFESRLLDLIVKLQPGCPP
ncbi:MAG: hypothetical protein OXG47_05025 [bacterium]|nr:hypothetical protein [bacterium]